MANIYHSNDANGRTPDLPTDPTTPPAAIPVSNADLLTTEQAAEGVSQLLSGKPRVNANDLLWMIGLDLLPVPKHSDPQDKKHIGLRWTTGEVIDAVEKWQDFKANIDRDKSSNAMTKQMLDKIGEQVVRLQTQVPSRN